MTDTATPTPTPPPTPTPTPEPVSFKDPQWKTSFVIDGLAGGPIAMHQMNRKTFGLDSTIEYIGEETGLEDLIDEDTLREIRYVTPDHLASGTDLTSVPGPLRWFTGRYGSHTPAALIHDRFIGGEQPGDLNDQYVDRYFRFMLHATGVRWLKRWLMWAAVAMRTRFAARGGKRVTVIMWAAAMLAGFTTFTIAAAAGNWGIATVALLAPVPFTALWGRQYGAGLAMAYSVPWLIPPALLALVSYGLYLLIEGIATLVLPRDTRGTDTFKLQG